MKKYILFGLTLLMAFPVSIAAQNEDATEDEDVISVLARKLQPKHKQYPTRVIRGRVVSATTGQPIAGTIISADDVEGYSTLTEENGTFKLNVPTFTTSVYINMPDYNPVRLGLQNTEQQLEVKLYPQTFSKDYGKDINVRNDYSTDDFTYTNSVNIKEEVQKHLGAQVYSITRNGTPGVGNVMFVQGLNSLNVNAQPLVVIDDVIIDQQYGRTMLHEGFFNDILSTINPADIEKVTVIRNGTALYGAKGANGVILIQTHRSKSMATRITANISAGVTLQPKFISVMDAEQYRSYTSELLKSTNTRNRTFKFLKEDPDYYYYTQYHQNTDWKDYVYRTAMTQNYGINIEGGDAVANYNLSVGYITQQSTLKYNDMDRLNIRFNTDISLSDRFDIRFDASFGNITRDIRNDGAPAGYDEGTPTAPGFLAYIKSPFMSPYSYGMGRLSDTHYDIDQESYLSEALANYKNYNWKLGNPAAINEYSEAENKNRLENSMLNLTVTPKFRLTRNLTISEHFSYNLVNTNEAFYIPINGTPSYYVGSIGAYRDNEVRSLASKQNSVLSDTRLDWQNRYNAHFIHLFGGARINWESYSMTSLLGYNTGNDKQPFLKSSLTNTNDFGTSDNWNSLAWYAQAEYNYLGRYFLQANLTVEGSSRFGRDGGDLRVFDAAWGIFPGVQAAWIISNEPWMAKMKAINFLRLSAGFDVSGNDDIDYYAARSFFSASQFLNTIAGISFDGIGNTKIQWETTRRINVGLEANLFNNRLSIGLNGFRSTTDNLLTRQSLGFLSGLNQNWTNDGKLKNIGFDASAAVKVLALKDFQWEVGASVGHFKNEITQLPEGASFIDNDVYGATIRTQVGQAANLFYGHKSLGVFATTAEADAASLFVLKENGIDRDYYKAGDIHFADLDGDHQITDADRTVIGDPNPDIYGNIFTTLSYKHLKLDLRFNYSLGNDVYNYQRSQLEGGSRFMNQTTAMLRRWQVEGQVTDIPQITFQDPLGNSRFSDRWIEDGSYLRLKTVTLSYDLPLRSEYLQGLQFWVQANNVFTLTKYLGSDPEFTMTSNVIGQGIDLGQISQSRSFVAGIKIKL
ncbi:MAG: SusC/RagA family TonB-linked outer membrane protein [Prevotella sp.]|nr:SusC/RagA family TonB-linked outer membrane protein [Prevotella sp.]